MSSGCSTLMAATQHEFVLISFRAARLDDTRKTLLVLALPDAEVLEGAAQVGRTDVSLAPVRGGYLGSGGRVLPPPLPLKSNLRSSHCSSWRSRKDSNFRPTV